jgi:hypothetical protein
MTKLTLDNFEEYQQKIEEERIHQRYLREMEDEIIAEGERLWNELEREGRTTSV